MWESKKPFIPTITLSLYSLLLVCNLFVGVANAEDVYTRVNTFFVSLDSIVASVTYKVSKISKLDPTDNYFIDVLNEHGEFEYLMRTNSKGKIISKVIDGKASSRTYRFIGDQAWHKATELTQKPYYGNIIQKKGYFLFWNRPIKVRTKYGSRFGGAVAAKIDIVKCFQTIAKKNGISFQVIYRKKSIFSNISKDVSGSLEKHKLGVYGMPGLVIRYPSSKVKPAVAATKPPEQQEQMASVKTGKDQVPAQKSAAPQVKADKKKRLPQKKMAKEPDKKTTQPGALTTKKDKDKSSGPVSMMVIIIVIVVCVGIMIICFIALKRAADKRKRLIEAIDKGEI